MKKVLIIEDDQIVANVYRNKLAVEGYQAESAPDGESGLKLMRTFQPDVIVLDLMLPKMSGVDVIKQIRSEAEFSKLPIIVFSNTYLTNLIQEAWKAGATKCLSKANCSPKEVLDVVRHTIGDSGAIPLSSPPTIGTHSKSAKPATLTSEADSEFQADLRKTFIDGLPATLAGLRSTLQSLVKADNEMARLKEIYELYRRVHALNGNAGIAGLVQIAHMSAAVEALLKELYEKPKNINTSTLRTVAASVDFLGFLFERGTLPEKQEPPNANILVVDDEAISRRAVIYALEKAHLQSVNTEDPNAAFKLLSENHFDLVFLDVDMPGMTGFELCTKLRAMPMHKKTPVVFVTSLSDFDNRTSSTMAGGNDFIAKPFLFIELTVKALIHVLRGKMQTVK
ncbi:MAG TPA: response regulator [Candidatus Baltobacteraceae bacterium]|nr:response regulator [Candidatus Baltobacteraceae bacterium]